MRFGIETKIIVMALMMALTVACSQKKDSSTGVNAGRGVRLTAGPSANYFQGQGGMAGTQSAMVTSTNQFQLDESVKALVSTTLDPQTVGAVRSIELRGQVRVDGYTGQMMPGQSRIWLTIADSNVGTSVEGQTVQPIQISVTGTSGSAVNYNANLTFADQYGSITIQGTFNNSTFQGTVSFANTAGSGYNGKRSGTLGQFSIPTCAFFVCQ